MEVRGVEQDFIPYIGQLVLTIVPVEGWIIDPYEHGLLDVNDIGGSAELPGVRLLIVLNVYYALMEKQVWHWYLLCTCLSLSFVSIYVCMQDS